MRTRKIYDNEVMRYSIRVSGEIKKRLKEVKASIVGNSVSLFNYRSGVDSRLSG